MLGSTLTELERSQLGIDIGDELARAVELLVGALLRIELGVALAVAVALRRALVPCSESPKGTELGVDVSGHPGKKGVKLRAFPDAT